MLHINSFGQSKRNDVHGVSSHYCLLKVGQTNVKLNSVPKISANLPAVIINIKDIWKELEHEKLDCSLSTPKCKIDMILELNTFMR